MELEEFNKMWNKTTEQSSDNLNIDKMIHAESKGPLTILEKKLKATIIIFPFAALLFAAVFASHEAARQSLVMWLLLTILSVEFIVALLNYSDVLKIKQPDGTIKDNLHNKVVLLRKRLRNYLVLHLLLYTLMAALLEFSLYHHVETNFGNWANVPPAIRVSIYIAFLTAQYFVKQWSERKNYGQYLQKLLNIEQQML